jgi:hypothetical protein
MKSKSLKYFALTAVALKPLRIADTEKANFAKLSNKMTHTKCCKQCCRELSHECFDFKNDDRVNRDGDCRDCKKSSRGLNSEIKDRNIQYRVSIRNAVLRNEIRRDAICKKLLEYMEGKKCETCGYDDVRALEFDHIAPVDKADSISNLLYAKMNWERAMEEMKKCRILCSNCHSLHTAEQQGHRKIRLAKLFHNK